MAYIYTIVRGLVGGNVSSVVVLVFIFFWRSVLALANTLPRSTAFYLFIYLSLRCLEVVWFATRE